jgi:hypothetical protein
MPETYRCPECGFTAGERDVVGNGRVKCPDCGLKFSMSDARPEPHGAKTGLILLLVLGGGGLLIALGFVVVCGLWFWGSARPAQQPGGPAPQIAIDPEVGGRAGLAAVGKDRSSPAVVSVSIPNGPRARCLVFAGPGDGPIGVLREKTEVNETRVSLFDPKTGRPAGEVSCANNIAEPIAISPGGKWVAHMTSGLNPKAVVLVPPGDPAAARRFTPAPQGAANTPWLVWITFVAPDRLLTLYKSGGFDVWSVPAFERVASRPATGNFAGLGFDAVNQTPEKFAINPERTTVAILEGTEFILFDPKTAAEKKRLAPLAAEPARLTDVVALSADGSSLACVADDRLVVWDTESGQIKSDAVAQLKNEAFGLSWWGRDHVLVHDVELTKAVVLEAATGARVGEVRVAGLRQGMLSPLGPGDRLWAAYTPLLGLPGRLFAFGPPAGLKGGKGLRYEVGSEGLTAGPPARN